MRNLSALHSLPEGFHNPVTFLKTLSSKSEEYFIKRGEKKALYLFHQMATRVPAYKDFLKKNKVNLKAIKTSSDFKHIPLVDKNNYLRKYPLELLCWDGNLDKKSTIYATTSGSTGEPFYFPREKNQDLQYAATAEMYLRSNFNIHKKTTLYICGFAMGAWIGGLFTYQAIRYVAERGKYPLSIITPGSSKEEVIKALKNIGHLYDQVIIGGYPPFIKDTIDYGTSVGINWKKYKLGFIFSADSFSELFRDYIIQETGLTNFYKDTLNHYGTVDLGTMSHETPLAILIRRLAIKNETLNKNIFTHNHKQPTLTQYLPELFYFEELEEKLICSAFSGIPLFRYDLKDIGTVMTLKQIKKMCSESGIDLLKEAKKVKIDDTIWNLPFVMVYERADYIVKIFGANIYPETIKKALCEIILSHFITSKFTLAAKFDKKQNQYLEINVELKPGVRKSKDIEKQVLDIILHYLLKENSEFKYLYSNIAHSHITPKIILWEYNDPLYFKPGGKQKWVKI